MNTERSRAILAARRGQLTLVALALIAVQLWFGPWTIAASWDEAIYLSQVGDGPALPFVPSRARGVVALVAPFAAAELGLPAIRVALVLVASTAIVLAFAAWTTVLGRSAALWACGIFAVSWLPLAQASAVMPNLWAAIAAVATVGAATRAERDVDRRWIIATGCFTAVTVAFRPLDGAVVVGTLVVWAAARRAWPLVWTAVVGGVVGISPWVLEMTVRAGGLANASAEAMGFGHVRASDPLGTALAHLWLADGPFTGTADDPSVLPLMWLAAAIPLTVAGLRLASGPHGRAALRLAVAIVAALAVAYVVLVDTATARFLLPVYGLMSLPMGVGADAAWAGGRPRRFVLVAFAAVWAVSHAVVAHGFAEDADRQRSVAQAAGVAVRRAVNDDACIVAGKAWPQISYAGRCEGRLDVPSAPAAWGADPSDRLFVATGARAAAPPGSIGRVFLGPELAVHEIAPPAG